MKYYILCSPAVISGLSLHTYTLTRTYIHKHERIHTYIHAFRHTRIRTNELTHHDEIPSEGPKQSFEDCKDGSLTYGNMFTASFQYPRFAYIQKKTFALSQRSPRTPFALGMYFLMKLTQQKLSPNLSLTCLTRAKFSLITSHGHWVPSQCEHSMKHSCSVLRKSSWNSQPHTRHRSHITKHTHTYSVMILTKSTQGLEAK